MKKQRGRDKADVLGEPVPEVNAAVALTYPENAGERQHYHEPYEPLAGPIENVTAAKKKPKGGKLGPLDAKQIAETKQRRARYDTYIDALYASRGNREVALAEVYGLPVDDIRADFGTYLADVMAGQATSSIGDLLEERGLGKAARANMLVKHAYSEDPKESLVALKMATDLDGDKHDMGTSYEHHLRDILGKA